MAPKSPKVRPMRKTFFLCLILLQSFLAEARVYDFKKLYEDLGYKKQTNYFNSTQDELMAIESYIDKYDNFYGEINDFLRFHPMPYEWSGTGPEDAKWMVAGIDHIISKAPEIPSDIILFRGLTLKWRGNKAFTVGEEFLDKAFVSTSTTYSEAEYFAKGLSDPKRAKEKKALFALYFDQEHVKGLMIDQGEDEIILNHGKKFRIMEKKVKAEYDLYLVQVCTNTCNSLVKRKEISSWWKTKN